MTIGALEVGAGPWTERYEALRHYVLEGRQRLQSQPLGLALWMARGMAGWMRQWTQLLTPAAAPVTERPRARVGEPGPWQQPLTMLLAQITLQHLEPRRAL
jgi:hypothetical protein